MKTHRLFLYILVLILSSCRQENKTITFESLLEEMIDRESIASYPDPYYVTRQFSSYDRDSKASGDASWFANWDRSMFIREEQNNGRREFVMVDTDGPGALVRFWMTFAGDGAGEGTLRIYLDNSDEPSIEGSAIDILSTGGLIDGAMSCPVSPQTEMVWRGHNLYLPIPYNKHIKVTYESEHVLDAGAKSGGEAVYYNINYRTYEKGVEVETYSADLLEEHADQVDRVNTLLDNRNNDLALENLQTQTQQVTGTIAPGAMLENEFNGSNAIRRMVFRVSATNLPQALRSTVVEIIFDDQATVWCPIGDFFGTGYQLREVNTWYARVDPEAGEMASWWVMPFEKKMVIRLHNMGQEAIEIAQGDITLSDWQWTSNSMHFGATWHQYTNLFTGSLAENFGQGDPFDVNFTHLRGEGVVVGDNLTLFHTSYDWWGEGDEKIYIDGEDFPSHFGTGTEDYYGYAWCRPETFNTAFIAQPDGSANFNPGYTVNIRYRSLDAMPFTKELKFDMEMWHWTSNWINYAPTTFFYLKPGAEILVERDEEGAQAPVALKREDMISPWVTNNVVEGENLIEVSREGGEIFYQWSEAFGWSGNQHTWWRKVPSGSELVLAFRSEKEETRNITLDLTTAPDYGVAEISFNNAPAVRFDGYNRDGVKVKQLPLGRHLIQEGLNEIRIRMITPAPGMDIGMVGVDLVRLQ